ncbi:MAG: VWA domain-containing protein [Verrucomicrobiota bacterium]
MMWERYLGFQFGHWWWLLLLPVLVWWFWRQGRTGPAASITHSSTRLLSELSLERWGSPGKILRCLRFAALAVLILGMARPRIPYGEEADPNKGIDIMLVCDVSQSMDTEDFVLGAEKMTRREALVMAISEFVDNRINDRVGMIGFAKNVYLLSPMTTDANWIKSVFKMVQLKGGTAIGDGLYAGVDKLMENDERSKVIILVTDGLNNEGTNPLDAGQYAKEKGVRVYALEIMNIRRVRASNYRKSKLAEIATETGGQYFQASDTQALLNIYREIDKMEKHEFEANRFTLFEEWFPWFLAFSLGLLSFEWAAARTFWMRLP